MKIAVRRRLAVGVAATTTALVAGLLVAPAASAANITSVDPTFAVNNDPSEVVTARTESDFAPGSTITLTRVGTSGESADSLSATVANDANAANTKSPRATFNFLDTGDGAADGPANPGLYNVTVTQRTGLPGGPDSCQNCFTVISAVAPSVTAADPQSLAQGGADNVTFRGNGFARGTRVELLLPGTTTVDPNITANGAPTRTGTPDECLFSGAAPGCTVEVDERTTPTSLLRRVTVQTAAVTGPRDVRVTNTDGARAVCAGCFTVNGAALTGVSPDVASNSSATPTVSITFSGTNVPRSGEPRLVFVGASTGSATRESLTIVGSNATFGANSVTADFPVQNAAPGANAYQPVLVQTDGSQNACTCRFSIAQPSPASVSSLDPNTIGQSDSRTVTVRGSGLSSGVSFTVSGTGVTVASVRVISASEARVNIQTAANAAPGQRSVTPTTTDGRAGTTCTNCLTVTAAGASASPSATPTTTMSPAPGGTASRYAGLASPVRVLDTRQGDGGRRSGLITLDLSGRISDPNATAAVLNVTVTNGSRRGFLVAYPSGNTKPGTSNVNFEGAQAATADRPASAGTQANEVVVGLSRDRKVSLFVDSAQAHVIADLVGTFTTSTAADTGRVSTNAPVRALDTRSSDRRTRRGEIVLDLSGRLPSGATSAILNVTVTETSGRGFVTVFPTGTDRPSTSNVNFERGQTQANEVVTRVGAGGNAGQVSLFVDSANAAVVVDVVGAVTPGEASGTQVFTALAQPERAIDTRTNRGSRRTGNVVVQMPTSVPGNATGVVLNVTATNGSRAGFVTVFPAGQQNPGTSNVNFPVNLTQANEVVSALGSNRSVTLFVGGANSPQAHVIVDVVGYLTGGAASSPSGSPSATATATMSPGSGGGGGGGLPTCLPGTELCQP